MNQTIFHLAFAIADITQTKAFYIDGLGCIPGRETHHALILNLYGHQLVAHLTKEPLIPQHSIYPRHFGLVFSSKSEWQNLLNRAQNQQLKFREPPKQRFTNSPLEHYTFFLEDPSYNLIEFKYYHNPEAIFGNYNNTPIGDSSS